MVRGAQRTRVLPDLVEPRHREHPTVLGADEERLLDRLALRVGAGGGVPLEVAVGGQQAAPLGEGLAIGLEDF